MSLTLICHWLLTRVSSTDKASFTFTIPSCLSGQYLFRIEQLGLHVASTVNGVQPYIACANLDIAGSSDASPAAGSPYLVSFPGVSIHL
jgi:hypothetical protein